MLDDSFAKKVNNFRLSWQPAPLESGEQLPQWPAKFSVTDPEFLTKVPPADASLLEQQKVIIIETEMITSIFTMFLITFIIL
jgi:hypothetical protein